MDAEPLDFDDLRRAAREARFQRWLAGHDNPGKRRLRPRTPEEFQALRQAHRDRLDRFPPREENGVLILPYWYDTERK